MDNEKMMQDFSNGATFEIGEKNPYNDYFTGQSYLNMLAKDDNVAVSNVTFEPSIASFN